jgi:hypothetical protein
MPYKDQKSAAARFSRNEWNKKTNQLRGLLHSECNSGLGLLGDSMEILLNAVEYLNNKKWLK